jgi:hypothetical protein
MSRWSAGDLDEAVGMLSSAPKYDHPDWFDAALGVRERWQDGAESLAIPTWFYGHEPSNLFSSHIAKYFATEIVISNVMIKFARVGGLSLGYGDQTSEIKQSQIKRLIIFGQPC